MHNNIFDEIRAQKLIIYSSDRGMKFDTSKEGLLTLFKPYQTALLEHIWELNVEEKTEASSGQAYEYI